MTITKNPSKLDSKFNTQKRSLDLVRSSLRICSSAEMRELDEVAERDFGITPSLLMENAGRAASQVILEYYPDAGDSTEILVFAGCGNNAGDAFVVARRFLTMGRRVRVFYVEAVKKFKPAVMQNFEILKKLGAKMVGIDSIAVLDSFLSQAKGPFTVVDGILGTGLKGPLEGLYYELVEAINQMKAREVIALDIPSGVHGQTGADYGMAIQADLTISFGFPKLGHFFAPGAAKRGTLINVDIPLPHAFRKEGGNFLLMPEPLSTLLRDRDRYGHKNSFGHTLLVGGRPGRVGAIVLASNASHRMGTGLVTVATWEKSYPTLLAQMSEETMAVPILLDEQNLEKYKSALHSYSSIVIGPGLGTDKQAKMALSEILKAYKGPMVLDADALTLVAETDLYDLLLKRAGPTVLTPHPGEMARLLKVETSKVLEDPVGSLKQAVEKTGAVVLLKGAATLVSSPDSKVFLNHYPNDGMATAGSGDVLAGMIGGLLGQGMDALESTILGVYLHSLAGAFAAKELGHRSMTARDLVGNISNAFKQIENPIHSSIPIESRAKLL